MHRTVIASIAALSAAVCPPSPAGAAGTFDYHGFRFDTAAIDGAADEAAILDGAKAQVEIVEGVGLTPATLTFLRGYVVHLSRGSGGGHFGRDGVAINLTAHRDDRPILLHEEMHAFQNGRLPGGMRNPAMRRFFARARTPGLWPAGSYMLRTEGEFFAMTTSVALYGHAARPPFTRAALAARQPDYLAWIAGNVR